MKHLLLLLLGIVSINCKNDTAPPQTATRCDYPPGNRVFSWRSDTVAWFPSWRSGMWAFSDSDAYMMGYIVRMSHGKSVVYLGLHWNGATWDTSIYGTAQEIKHVASDATGDDHFMVSVGWCSLEPLKAGLGEFDNRTKKWKGYQFETPGQLYSVWTDGKGYFIACGTNGMVYTKDGYASEWVYQKAPTNFTFTRVVGVSKNELYLLGNESLVTGEFYSQLWRYMAGTWTKLMDNQDPTGMPIQISQTGENIYDIAAFRCPATDSLTLYLIGPSSMTMQAKGQSLTFVGRNLASKGLPGASSYLCYIKYFSPNDYWVAGLEYELYHWNGSNFQKMEPIPTWPYGQLTGAVRNIQRTRSGKTWMIVEMSSQVFSVIQGVP